MRVKINPGKQRRSINFIDNIVYSHVHDLQGNPMELTLSLMVQNGNCEMRLASGRDDEVSTGKQPLVIWINGAGWRGVDKNLMAAEMEFLAEAGFAVANIYYRSSKEGHFPAQLVDCKTAVRYLRSHAEEYGIDPEHIGVIGRSAGGHLAAFLAMNSSGFDSREWTDTSSKVQAAVDMFGLADIPMYSKITFELIKRPDYRWHSMAETHEGALFGVTGETTEEEILAMGAKASPINYINEDMCPMAIFHGDQDPLVPLAVSEHFYEEIQKAGLGDRTDFYVVENGGHGTREFFQPMTKQIIADFFIKHLKLGRRMDNGTDK